MNTREFRLKGNEVHNGFYSYSDKTEYKNKYSIMEIICPEHGPFEQQARVHLRGSGCPCCGRRASNEAKTATFEHFLRRAREVHGDKYEYIESSFTKMSESVEIICPKHGKFTQRAQSHVEGRGCPTCRESKLEKTVSEYLEKEGYEFEEQKTFDWLVNSKTDRNLHLDFYLPNKKLAIECQGSQHFSEGRTFSQDKTKYERTVQCDDEKHRLCEENGIKIVYFANNEFYIKGYRYPVVTELEQLVA